MPISVCRPASSTLFAVETARAMRTRNERPRDRHIADQCDELAPLHVSPMRATSHARLKR
jgi:hypothetical protein